MNDISKLKDILELSVAQRLEIAAAIWDSLAAAPGNVPVPDWHREIVEQRLEDDDAETTGESWSDVRRRIEGSS